MKIRSMLITWVILMLLMNTSFADTSALPSITFEQVGLIQVNFSSNPESGQVLMVKANGQEIIYPLVNTTDSFPLQLGNGDYTVTMLKNLQGTEYLPLQTWDYQISDSNNNLFLQSIQNIRWTKEDPFIKNYSAVFKKSTSTAAFIKAVHDDMVKRYNYDYDKLDGLVEPYIPDNNLLHVSNVGICYDFSSYFAAVMRAYEVPCKLIKGYRQGIDAYHAWNEVYLDGQWKVLDVCYDINMKELKQPIVLFQDSSNYTKVHEY